MIELLHSTVTKLSNFVSIHIGFVTNMRHEQTLCITLDLIWRKLQVGGKIAFYFPTKTCCLLQTKSNVCNLKKMFESHKTCSNAAHTWALDGVVQLIKALNYFPTVSLPEYDMKYSYKNPN